MDQKRAPVGYALNDPELVADPCGGFGRIREETPLARGLLGDGAPIRVVTRHDDVKSA